MKTIVESVAPIELRNLCGLVAAMLPQLKWRHNGLGLLQAYVHEGRHVEQRVHIWHKSLMRPGIEESGLLHDHRFDLTSTVLYGSLTQVEYELTLFDAPPFEAIHPGGWQLHTVVPARKALALSGTYDGLVEALPERYEAKTREIGIHDGQRYFFPKFVVHGTHIQTDLVITLVNKTGQEEAPAKILAPYGKRVVHAFADPYPEDMWRPVIELARTKLTECWRRDS